MKRLPLLTSLGVLALTTTFGVVPAQAAPSDVVGHTYVDDNTTGVNTIAAFDRHADGSLTPLAGSPFAIGGGGSRDGPPGEGAHPHPPPRPHPGAVGAGGRRVSRVRLPPRRPPTLPRRPAAPGRAPP